MKAGKLAWALAITGVGFLLLPLGVVIASSLGATRFLKFPPDGLSLAAYEDAFERTEFVDSLGLSLQVAAVVAVAATLLGTAAAVGMRRLRGKGAGAVESGFLAPLGMPHLVLGVAILQLVALMGLGVSIMTLAAGHLVICLPYTVRLIASALRGMDENVERAAATLGASAWYTFRRVTLPYLRPAVVAAAFIAANVSFDDVGIALFLANAETETLPVRIFHYLEFQFAPFIAAFGTILIVVPVIGAILIERFFGLGRLFGIGTQRRD